MLFMKKLAKCSAAMTISASGRAARERLAHAVQLGMQASLQRRIGEMGAAGDAGRVAADAGEDEAHSITSSARSRAATAGTVMPSAFADFTLTTSSSLVACSIGVTGGLRALQQAVDRSPAAGTVDQIGSVRDSPPDCVCTDDAQSRQTRARDQAPTSRLVEERIAPRPTLDRQRSHAVSTAARCRTRVVLEDTKSRPSPSAAGRASCAPGTVHGLSGFMSTRSRRRRHELLEQLQALGRPARCRTS